MTEPRVCPSSSYAAKVRLEYFNPTCRGKGPVVVRIGALAMVILVRIIYIWQALRREQKLC